MTSPALNYSHFVNQKAETKPENGVPDGVDHLQRNKLEPTLARWSHVLQEMEKSGTSPFGTKKLHKRLLTQSGKRKCYERSLMYLAIVVLTIIVIRSLIQIVIQYKHGPTSTQVNMMFNNSITLPVTAFCVPVTPENYMDTWPNESEITSVLAEFHNGTDFLQSDWSLPLLPVSHYLLGTITSYMENGYGMSQVDAAYPSDDAQWNTTRHLASFLSKWNLSLVDVARKFGREFVEIADVSCTIRAERNEWSPAAIQIRSILAVTPEQVCFRINLTEFGDSVAHKHPMDIVEITASLEKLKKIKKDAKGYIDFQGEPPFVNYRRLQFDADIGTRRELVFEVSAVYKALSKGQPLQCSDKQSYPECKGNCRIEAIRRLCNCVPYSWALYLNREVATEEVCTRDQYSTCLQYVGLIDVDCIKNCLPSCEYWAYKVEKRPVTPYISNETSFDVRVSSFVYPSFLEYQSYTIDNVMADFGGIIGLWLGASCLTAVQICIFIFRKLCDRHQQITPH